ncbi:MAG: hypothetical protein MUE65_03145, partial [Methanomassiliicoccales archaeon]|nr:hypothetical protein [Methanomassiliicoccales archaeon]
ASDASSGAGAVQYSLDGSAWGAYSSPIGISGEGMHTLRFNSSDLAGNVEAVQELNVSIDSTLPVTSFSVQGTEGLEGWFVGPATVELSASDSLSGVSALEWSLDGGAWTGYSAVITIPDSGDHFLRFFSRDQAGNEEEVREVRIKVDVSAPSSGLSIAGQEGEDGWYTTVIQVSPNGSDEGSGVASFLYMLDDMPSWSPLSGPLLIEEEGEHGLRWYAVDVAGNPSTVQERTLKVDRSAPATSLAAVGSQGDEGWFLSFVDVELSAQDGASGVRAIYYSVEGAAWREYSSAFTLAAEGSYEVSYYAIDLAGNVAQASAQEVRLELSAPLTLLALEGVEGSQGWYLSEVSASLQATDALSGVLATYYRLDGGFWQEWAGQLNLTDGEHILEYYSVDRAGNQEAFQGREVLVDARAPDTQATVTGGFGTGGWFRSQVGVALSSSDAVSGVNQTLYQVDDGPWSGYSSPLEIGEGRHKVRYLATDLAGNQAGLVELDVDVDWTSPESEAGLEGELGAGGWFVSPVNVTLTSQDGVSGVSYMEWRLDGGAWSTYARKVSVNSSGEHVLERRAVDAAGNSEDIRLELFKVDLDAPTFQVKGDLRPFTSGQVVIDLEAGDGTSSVELFTLRLDGGEYFTQPGQDASVDLGDLDDGWHELEVVVTDQAGNSVTDVVRFKVDTNPFSPEGPFGPWLLVGLAALAIGALLLVLPLRKRKK